MPENAFYTRLKNRGLIKISGPQAREFLQGLITNDINKLTPDKILYACFLTPQGKFLHDFFIHERGEELWLDCEGGERTKDLEKRLTLYKLRANVEISAINKNDVFAIFGAPIGLPDPRHSQMGYRSFDEPKDIEKQGFEIWDTRRISLTIPDGSRDLTIEKSTLDEGKLDTLNAVDYNKGCYIGQELTARMHYRGLGKKHLTTIILSEHPDADIRSTSGEIGIALTRSKS